MKDQIIKSIQIAGAHTLQITQDINRGGCGFWATTLGRLLEQLDCVKDVSVASFYWSELDFDEWRNNGWTPTEWHEKKLLKIGHMYTIFSIGDDVYMADANNCMLMEKRLQSAVGMYGELSGTLSLDECQELVDNPGVWNTMFPRNKMDQIEKKLSGIMSHLIGAQ